MNLSDLYPVGSIIELQDNAVGMHWKAWTGRNTDRSNFLGCCYSGIVLVVLEHRLIEVGGVGSISPPCTVMLCVNRDGIEHGVYTFYYNHTIDMQNNPEDPSHFERENNRFRVIHKATTTQQREHR